MGQNTIRFQKDIGNSGYDDGFSAKQTLDTGYIIGGSTSSFGNGNNDMYLIKTDKFGTPTMQATYGGINVDIGKCVRQTTDHGYIIVGYTNSFGAGGYDVYLVKTDSMLQTQWSRTYGGSDWDFGNCVEQTTDGGYIICGSTFSYGKGDQDYFLIKTNSAGDTLWTKTFGGANEDIAKSVIQTSDGGYILTGTSKSLGDTLGDFYTVKTDSIGDTLWTNKWGGPQPDFANDVMERISGGYIVCGGTKSYGSGSSDGNLIKISNAGITDTVYTVGFPGYEEFESITQRTDGKIAMIGTTTSLGYGTPGDVYFFLLNSDFTFYNSNTYGSVPYDIGYSIERTIDRGFIICGITQGFNSNGLDDIYFIKTDTLGNTTSSVVSFITNVETVNSLVSEYENLYPNPADKMIHLSINAVYDGYTSITISDIIGRKYLNRELKTNSSDKINIDLSTADFNNGMYFITIQNNDFIKTKSFIICH